MPVDTDMGEFLFLMEAEVFSVHCSCEVLAVSGSGKGGGGKEEDNEDELCHVFVVIHVIVKKVCVYIGL